jgi:hypothetical protein
MQIIMMTKALESVKGFMIDSLKKHISLNLDTSKFLFWAKRMRILFLN